MAQQVGGEGADRIQGFQAAPVVDRERGKTLKTESVQSAIGGDGAKSYALRL